MKKIVFLIVFLSNISVIIAQNERDAYRYSQDDIYGTARYNSLAGAMGAFGADFSTLSTNPATIGLYKRGEIAFTPVLSYKKSESQYNNVSSSRNKYSFSLGNLGMVWAFNIKNGTKWRMWQFATGYNQIADYNNVSIVKGPNEFTDEKSTFIDYLAPQLNGIAPSTLGFGKTLGDMLYYHWLVDPNPEDTFSYISLVDEALEQRQVMATDGTRGEYLFSGGANYDDKLFIGITMGIPFYDYSQKRTYSESKNKCYDSLVFLDNFRSKGRGINLKVGLIYQPISYVRLGISAHTPTLYNIKEEYDQVLTLYNVEQIDSNDYSYQYALGKFKYQLITPSKFSANVAFISKKWGFVDIDYEIMDYSTMQMQADINNYDFENENLNIQQYYQTTHTIKVGGELKLGLVALRLGYSYMTNPYTKSANIDGSRHLFSGGIGVKGQYFFIDFAYCYRLYSDKNVFYSANNLAPYNQTFRNQSFSITCGWKIGKVF